jgi:mercuric ion binding protein
MKIIFLYVILSLSLFSNQLFAKELKVHVNGMVCGFCAQGITKKFNARAEISKVNVNLKDKLVLLSTKDGKDIKDEDIRSILKDAGFAVEKIERN